MSKEFKLADPGEGLHEAEVLEVHVSAGDSVEDGDTVLTVETDKANTDIPAPFTGTIEEVKVSEGDTAEVGDVLMTYSDDEKTEDSEPDEDKDEDEGKDDTHENSSEEAETDDEQDEDASEEGDSDSDDDDDSEPADETTEDSDDQPDDQQPAHEKNVEMGDIESDDDNESESDDESEPEHDTESDDKSESKDKTESEDDSESEDDFESKGEDDAKASADADSNKGDDKGKQSSPVPAAPSTRRLAREKNVELGDIEPSGKHGRVTAEDVEAAAQTGGDQTQKHSQEDKKGTDRQRGAALSPGGNEGPALPDFSQWGEVERVPLRSIRRATAQNMARSWGQIPHVFHQDIADVTALERFRHEYEDSATTEGGKFTLTVLVMKALASALKQFPRFNASLDTNSQEIVLKHYCHIGLAVATDRGLLVPVIRDVDRKNLVELSAETTDIARKTRNGEVKREDMQGGSMIVTNPGPMGGSSLTPLINHPQVAILGMAQARLEPVVYGDLEKYEIKPRLRLPLVLGFDHRVNDGADAAQFVTYLIDSLADPESLLLNI